MTDTDRTAAWLALPEPMRKEILILYQSYWLTYNARRRLEAIFGYDNLNPTEKS